MTINKLKLLSRSVFFLVAALWSDVQGAETIGENSNLQSENSILCSETQCMDEDDCPYEFKRPISPEIMEEPVISQDDPKKQTSPITEELISERKREKNQVEMQIQMLTILSTLQANQINQEATQTQVLTILSTLQANQINQEATQTQMSAILSTLQANQINQEATQTQMSAILSTLQANQINQAATQTQMLAMLSTLKTNQTNQEETLKTLTESSFDKIKKLLGSCVPDESC